MSRYSDGEALVLTRLRAMSQFGTNNSSRGKWGILNSGNDAQYAILKPGGHTSEMMSLTTGLYTWNTIIQLWQRYKDDGDSPTSLESLTGAVVAEFEKYPRLGDTGGTIQDSQIVEIREMQQTPIAAPDWLYLEVVLEWKEESTISFAE